MKVILLVVMLLVAVSEGAAATAQATKRKPAVKGAMCTPIENEAGTYYPCRPESKECTFGIGKDNGTTVPGGLIKFQTTICVRGNPTAHKPSSCPQETTCSSQYNDGIPHNDIEIIGAQGRFNRRAKIMIDQTIPPP
ncbi:MAG: hypothetical protein SGJ05_10755 [bacterium]|nr:hypothetical protein [bacterium]